MEEVGADHHAGPGLAGFAVHRRDRVRVLAQPGRHVCAERPHHPERRGVVLVEGAGPLSKTRTAGGERVGGRRGGGVCGSHIEEGEAGGAVVEERAVVLVVLLDAQVVDLVPVLAVLAVHEALDLLDRVSVQTLHPIRRLPKRRPAASVAAGTAVTG